MSNSINQIKATNSVAASDQLPLTPWRIPHATYRIQVFDTLAASLRARGMGLILDVVHNHMGIGDP